jgi:hypothetical protein
LYGKTSAAVEIDHQIGINQNMAKTKSTKKKRPSFNVVRGKIRELAAEHNYDEQVLLNLAEFVNGGEFKPAELTLPELKAGVTQAFGCKSYAELKKNAAFKLYVADAKLKLNLKDSWKQIYREWVELPESERDAIGANCINGIDIIRNFRPWEVFGLDPDTASADDIKSAFRKLSLQYHPDQGGDAKLFERLKLMRDSLLAAYPS